MSWMGEEDYRPLYLSEAQRGLAEDRIDHDCCFTAYREIHCLLLLVLFHITAPLLILVPP
jgi:hypothetical protein